MNHILLKKAMPFLLAILLAFFTACSRSPAASADLSSGEIPSTLGSSPSQTVSLQSRAVSFSPASSLPSLSGTASKAALNENDKIKMENIKDAAAKGRVLHCDFAAKTNCIEDVEKVLGKGKDSGYIAAAKGFYVSYPVQGLVFGFNKGSQIFEVRVFDEQTQKMLTLSKIKDYFGKPAHDVKTAKEEILGYVVNKNFKLLFVFELPKTTGAAPSLDHYSVLYPTGTINSMADDPGRDW